MALILSGWKPGDAGESFGQGIAGAVGPRLQIPEIFNLSAFTIRIIKQNLFWAFFYNALGISLAIMGILNPILAAAAMLLSSVSVITNSLRLANRKPTC